MNYTKIILLILIFVASWLNAQVIYQRKQSDLEQYVSNGFGKNHPDNLKVGLVLSGGGARGITHIGVLRGFEKYNLPIDLIVGTSMGSVIGGFYAAGMSVDQLETSIRNIKWDDIFSDQTERKNLFLGQKAINDRYLISVRFEGLSAYIPSSLSSGQKILSMINDQLYKTTFPVVNDFDLLKIPFRAIATDLISGKRLVIAEGDLAEAINASVAIPLLFSPVVWNDKLLVDGGLSANFAVDAARSLGMDIIIVVDSTSPLRKREELEAPWEIADQVTSIMMQSTNAEQIQYADLVIKPDIEGIGSSDFDQIDSMILQGEKSVDDLAPQLYDLIEQNKNVEVYYHYDNFLLKTGVGDTIVNHPVKLFAQNTDSINFDKIQIDIDNLYSTGIYKSVSASINIHENKRLLQYVLRKSAKINEVVIKNNTIFPDSTLLKLMSFQPGKPFNINPIQRGINEIKQLYRDKGFALMHLSAIKFDEMNGILEITINEGMLDKISIAGNEISNDLIILREFPLNEGDIYNTFEVKKGIDNIYNTQLFDKVSVNVNPAADKYHLIIKVVEKKNIVLRLGGKIGTERGAQFYAEWADENFLGNAYKLYLTGRYGEMDRHLGLNYRADRVFESLVTVSIRGYYDWKRFPYYIDDNNLVEYAETRRGVKFGLGLQLQKLGQISVELKLENVKDAPYSNDCNEDLVDRLTQNSELRTLSVKSVTDKRDNIDFTKNGIYNIWFWETANQKIAQGQEKYTKAFVNLEGFYTYWTNHTFHFRGVIGLGDKTVPYSEWFRIGGLHDFIGLHKFEFFGRQVILSNLEYRYFIPFENLANIHLAIRYDIAGIWEFPDLVLKSEDFFTGIGGWIGLNTLLGPLYIGYGNSSNKSGVFYLSIGYDF